MATLIPTSPDYSEILGAADVRQAFPMYAADGDPMFREGFREVLDSLCAGSTILEICCGNGSLAARLSKCEGVTVIAIDRNQDCIESARNQFKAGNLEFLVGDATRLGKIADSSVDLVIGVAALHHLSHALHDVASELKRVLRIGGRCIFINEPLGHNWVVAAARAIHVSKNEWLDESNLFLEAILSFGKSIGCVEIHYYNLVAYFAKTLQPLGIVPPWMYDGIARLDRRLFNTIPVSRRYAANCNLVIVRES